ncbi:MAG TPA: hypothetical protein VF823_06185, partial [Anaerolineales bacterium]
DDLQEKGEAKSETEEGGAPAPEAEGGEEGLSVFEDFFEKMDLDDLDKGKDKDEGEEDDKDKD